MFVVFVIAGSFRGDGRCRPSEGGAAGGPAVSGDSAAVPGGDRGGDVRGVRHRGFLPRGRALPPERGGCCWGSCWERRLSPSSSWRPGRGCSWCSSSRVPSEETGAAARARGVLLGVLLVAETQPQF